MHSSGYDLPHSSGTALGPRSRYRRTFFALLLAFSGLALQAKSAHAQADMLRITRLNTDTLPELKVYLSYVSADGAVISGRAASDFKLSFDAAAQGSATALTLFEKVNEPIFVVTLAQVSGALREPVLNEVKAGFRRLGQTVSAAGRVSVLSYAGATKQLLDAGKASEVEGALAKLGVEAGGAEVHLLDALRTAIELLRAQPAGQRKLIVVVSDGSDVNMDKRGFIEISNLAQQAGIVIDTVGYNELEPAKLRNLQELARRSYGTHRVAKSAPEVGAQLGAVAEEVQNQYVVTFRLGTAGDDKQHTLQVTTESNGKPVYSNAVNAKLPAGPKRAPGKTN